MDSKTEDAIHDSGRTDSGSDAADTSVDNSDLKGMVNF